MVRDLDPQGLGRLLEFLAGSGLPPPQAYQRIRARLCQFFAWRGAHAIDELADETLTRVAMKLSSAERDRERPEAYVLGVARMIYLEWKKREGRWVAFDEAVAQPQAVAPRDGAHEWLGALEQCLQLLADSERSLLLRYHEAGGQTRGVVRQTLADEMSISLSALRVRVHRMRQQVEGCVRGRLAAP